MSANIKTPRAASKGGTDVSIESLQGAVAGAVPLTDVFAALRKRVPKAEQAQAEAFARVFYKRMTAE